MGPLSKKVMIKVAEEVILRADSTKIGKVSFASLGGLDLIHFFITDDRDLPDLFRIDPADMDIR